MTKRKILVTGSLGQIGSELVMFLRKEYGNDNVIASDIEKKDVPKVIGSGPFEKLDVLDGKKTLEVCKKYKVNTIIHLAALLSAVAEKNPQLAYQINLTQYVGTRTRTKIFSFCTQLDRSLRPLDPCR